jgi:hypothetical protein
MPVIVIENQETLAETLEAVIAEIDIVHVVVADLLREEGNLLEEDQESVTIVDRLLISQMETDNEIGEILLEEEEEEDDR